MNRKMIISLLSVIMVCALVGGATFAYFTDEGTNTNNTFSAGTLDMKMNDQDSITGTWVSPTNWAPGDTVDGTIEFSNIGTINARHIYFGFTGLTNDGKGDGSNLMDKIIVTNVQERFNGVTTANQAATLAGQVGDRHAPLTLRELTGWMTGGYGYYTYDDKSGDGIVLGAGNLDDYALNFTFQFDFNAGNEYQGDTCGFTLMANATQNSPTDGLVPLHEGIREQ